jgi:hypothetical protein
MHPVNPYPMRLFVAPYSILDGRIPDLSVDLSNVRQNLRLARIVDQFVLAKNKLAAIDELLLMKDPNHWNFFHFDSLKYNDLFASTINLISSRSTTNANAYTNDPAIISEAVAKTPVPTKFNARLYNRYKKYDVKLLNLLESLQLSHQCILKNVGKCSDPQIVPLDTIFIPAKKQPIFFWTANTSNQYTYNQSLVEAELHNLKRNQEVIVKFNFYVTFSSCAPGAIGSLYFFRIEATGLTEQKDKTQVISWAQYNSIIKLKTDENGNLTFVVRGGLNFCSAQGGVQPWTIDGSSYVQIDYPDDIH